MKMFNSAAVVKQTMISQHGLRLDELVFSSCWVLIVFFPQFHRSPLRKRQQRLSHPPPCNLTSLSLFLTWSVNRHTRATSFHRLWSDSVLPGADPRGLSSETSLSCSPFTPSPFVCSLRPVRKPISKGIWPFFPSSCRPSSFVVCKTSCESSHPSLTPIIQPHIAMLTQAFTECQEIHNKKSCAHQCTSYWVRWTINNEQYSQSQSEDLELVQYEASFVPEIARQDEDKIRESIWCFQHHY